MTTLTMKEEAARDHTKSVSGRADDGRGGLGFRSTERQCYRMKARVKRHGVKGVVDGDTDSSIKKAKFP